MNEGAPLRGLREDHKVNHQKGQGNTTRKPEGPLKEQVLMERLKGCTLDQYLGSQATFIQLNKNLFTLYQNNS